MSYRSYGGAMAAAAASIVVLALPAPASAVNPHDMVVTPDPIELEGYCPGFTAVVTFTQFNQIVRETTAADGTRTLKITGVAKATVTNQTTGESVTYNISGPGTVVIYPDDSFSIDAAGPNLLWTLPENLENFPDVPTISYTAGHVTAEVDASGQTTSYTLAGGGRQTDVCTVLAS